MMDNPKCIENPVRFSHSTLWEIQQNYFQTMGIEAWKNQVPFYISSNMFIATEYASFLISTIQNLLRVEPALRAETFYFLELGAGTGRFSYYFLTAFEKLLKTYALEDLKYCYIISDIATKNIEFCQTNPSFQPYIEAGKIDFAKVNLVESDSIFLLNKQIDYTQINAKTPLGVIANYVFDCIKIDLFKFDKSGVYEVQLGLTSRYKNFNIAESKYLDDLRLQYDLVKIDPKNYYEDKDLAELLLDAHTQFSEKEFYYPMPVGAIQFLKTLSKMTHDRFFIVSGDRGLSSEQDLVLTDLKELIAFNGCFSFLVNFYALKKYIQKRGGDALLDESNVSFGVNFFSKGLSLSNLPQKQIGSKEYCDFYLLFFSNEYRFDADPLLSFLKTSQYDPNAYACIQSRLLELYSTLTPYRLREANLAVQRVRENLYHSSIGVDVFNLIGIFYVMSKQYDLAIEAFQSSISVFKENSEAYRNLALVYQEKQDPSQALQYFKEAYHHNQRDNFSKQKMFSLMGKPTFNWVFPVIKTFLVCCGLALAFYVLSK